MALLSIFVASGIAHAEPVDRPDLRYAIAVNSPWGWATSSAFGASGYVGLGDRHAIRINAALYRHRQPWASRALSEVAGDGEDGSYKGWTTDVGCSWMYFARRRWSGPFGELGIVFRHRDVSTDEISPDVESASVITNVGAGRALVGWSWLFDERWFAAISVGASVGYEVGTRRESNSAWLMDRYTPVHGRYLDSEAFVRIGRAF